MSEPFIAEIRIVACNFAPRGWAFCDGQLLPIAQNTALFSLIGTTYGGDGRSTTALPNLQGRAPMHPGRGPGLTTRQLGEIKGTENTTLLTSEIPSHSHSSITCTSSGGTQESPENGVPANTGGFDREYTSTAGNEVNMHTSGLSATGGGQSHSNVQPYLSLNFVIALQGLYPSRS
ncbi:MAG: phage tail protein [Chitinophagales bacterium]